MLYQDSVMLVNAKRDSGLAQQFYLATLWKPARLAGAVLLSIGALEYKMDLRFIGLTA
jgi:hypothetical protein